MATCIVIGAGHAGAQLAVGLRPAGWEGDVVLLGAEPDAPYHRPPLSKSVLAGTEEPATTVLRPAGAYERAGVDVRLGVRVEAVDRAAREVVLADGTRLAYDALALCTGATPRRLPVPGADLPGVLALRTLADCLALRARVRPGGRAAIVGGGYIGLEAAATLRGAGMHVTVLEGLDRVLQRVASKEVSAFAARVHAEEGVVVRTGAAVTRIVGEASVEGVELADGELVPAELVLVGIGVVPDTALAVAAGLEVADGIVVDAACRTSDPAIVAAGDCTSHPNPHLGRRVRLESVPNANDQAKVAAATIAGVERTYPTHPWFWSEQYDTRLQIAGVAHEVDQVVVRGDPTSGRSFAVFSLSAGRLVAAECVNRPGEFMAARKLVGGAVDAAALADESVDPKSLVAG